MASSDEKQQKEEIIQGDNDSLEISDMPLKEYEYDDISFFTKHIQPEKELLNLIDNPEFLIDFDKNNVVLNFDEFSNDKMREGIKNAQ